MEADLDSSRLRTGEIVAGIGGIALFFFLFFDWFGGGGAEVSGSVAAGTLTVEQPGVSGWDALSDLPGFLIILSGVAGIALAGLAANGLRLNIPLRRGAFTAALGALAVLLILWRLVAGSPTLKIGVFLGLAAAIAITAGALMALAEDGFEVLVPVAGARTQSASATAPAAAPATPAPTAIPVAPAAKTPARSTSRSGTSTKRSTAKKPATRKKSSSSRSSGSRSGSKTKTRSTSSKSRSSSGSSKSRSSGSSKSRSSGSSKSRSSGSRSRSSGSRK
jgi:hypothetical protein